MAEKEAEKKNKEQSAAPAQAENATANSSGKKLKWRSRSIQITINNPDDKGYTRKRILDLVQVLNPRCVAVVDEVGLKDKTKHTHIYVYRNNAMYASRIQNLFPHAHLEKCNGTAFQNRDYLQKIGTDKNIAKAGTQIPGSYFEWGDFPTPKEELNPRLYHLVEMVQAGMTDEEILDDDVSYALSLKNVHELRDSLHAEKCLNGEREVKVIYVYGSDEEARYRYVLQNHKAKDIARCLYYGSPQNPRFDSYNGEDVLALENYIGAFPVQILIAMMQPFPLMLPGRYHERIARYHYLYLLNDFDPSVQWARFTGSGTQSALLKHVNQIVEIHPKGSTTVTNIP